MLLKPHLWFRRNSWSCALPDFWVTRVWGFGRTPSEAYMDWLEQINRYRLFGEKS